MEKELVVQRCPKCKADKGPDHYHADKWGKRGAYCRTCVLEYKRAWRERQGIAPRRPATPKEPKPVSMSYQAVHKRTRQERGPASAHSCEGGCGQRAEHWAYDGKDPDELTGWSNQSRDRKQVRVRYSAKPSHYRPLCRSCHATFDARPRPVTCPCGCNHTFTPGKVDDAPPNKPVSEW